MTNTFFEEIAILYQIAMILMQKGMFPQIEETQGNFSQMK